MLRLISRSHHFFPEASLLASLTPVSFLQYLLHTTAKMLSLKHRSRPCYLLQYFNGSLPLLAQSPHFSEKHANPLETWLMPHGHSALWHSWQSHRSPLLQGYRTQELHLIWSYVCLLLYPPTQPSAPWEQALSFIYTSLALNTEEAHNSSPLNICWLSEKLHHYPVYRKMKFIKSAA